LLRVPLRSLDRPPSTVFHAEHGAGRGCSDAARRHLACHRFAPADDVGVADDPRRATAARTPASRTPLPRTARRLIFPERSRRRERAIS
jgi:hypothetical protein